MSRIFLQLFKRAKTFGEQGNPEFATILKFLNALGLTLHVSKASVTVSNA
jgi:DNA-binding phage protein